MSAVGINLSSSKISVIELAGSRKDIIIKNIVKAELPSNSIIKGEVQNPIILANGLKEIWKKYKISDRKVFIGIANQKVIVKEVKIPVVDDIEIANSVKYQISDFIPIPKDNIIYDYFVIEKEESFSRLMLVGALKSMIDSVVESFKKAGLLAQAIDLNCFALYRTIDYIYELEKNRKKNESNIFCIVYLGREISIIGIIQNNNLKYPRFTSTSINSFIERIYKEIKKDNKYCEEIIDKFDFRSLLVEGGIKGKMIKEQSNDSSSAKSQKKEDKKSDKDNIENIDDKNITEIMKDTADHVIYEISLSLEHFLQENPKNKIDKIILTGEYIKNIDKYIKQKLNYKVELLNIADYFSLKYLLRNPNYRDKNLNYLIDPLSIGMALRGLSK
ncbi:MAG: pilus assembly protein PilM [Chloroflexi bacterium]|nr:pilus assembly protein PilM [Chloroflexota bacterium]